MPFFGLTQARLALRCSTSSLFCSKSNFSVSMEFIFTLCRASQLLNKVAGTYGLLALFTGGSLAQLSLYLYSVCGLFAYGWGLKAVQAVCCCSDHRIIYIYRVSGKCREEQHRCPYLPFRPSSFDTLDRFLWSGLVGIHPSRRSASYKLGSSS